MASARLVLFSIGTSAVNEYTADNWLNLRGKTLAEAVEKLFERALEDPAGREGEAAVAKRGGDVRELVAEFYHHPDIRVLMNGKRKPSAIEARRYALTALKVLAYQRHETAAALRSRLDVAAAEIGGALRDVSGAAGAADLGQRLAARLATGADAVADLGDEAVATLDAAVARMEREFDEVMDRASGWYLRKTKLMLFAIGLALAIGSNIDILRYADRMLTAGDLAGRVDTVSEIIGSPAWACHVSENCDADRTAEAAKTGAPAAAADDPDSVSRVAMPQVPDILDGPRGSELEGEIDLIFEHMGMLDVQVGWDCIDVPDDRIVLPLSERYCLWRTGASAGPGAGAAHAQTGDGAAAGLRLGLPFPTASQVLGWILIAFGVTFGARMWFDLVKRLIDLRTAGIPRRTA